MKCLLIGGAGLLGAQLAPVLDAAGHEVFILDNFSGSTSYRAPKEFPIITADATNYTSMQYVFNKVQPDIIIVMVNHFYDRDGQYVPLVANNLILNSANSISALLTKRIKKVIYCSHSDVYGGPETSKAISESRKITMPSSLRGASNLSAEQIFTVKCASLGVSLVNIRLFDMIGPRIKFTPVSCKLNFIIDAILKKEQIGLVGA